MESNHMAHNYTTLLFKNLAFLCVCFNSAVGDVFMFNRCLTKALSPVGDSLS